MATPEPLLHFLPVSQTAPVAAIASVTGYQWRVLAVRKNPAKGVEDSHTPQLMKLQLLLAPALLLAIAFDNIARPWLPAPAIVLVIFLLSTLPFALRAAAKDPIIGLLSPALLAARACAQFMGVTAGLIYARQKPSRFPSGSPA